ncbi:MAG TPA: fatty acid desaturase [Cyclobacteriaceae bacterium]|nr:fatty acid desaturase [Cyclobacteriaceae bacterium]
MNRTLRKIGFFSAFILPLLVVAGFYGGGWWNYLSVLFAFILLPLIDQLIGLDTSNIPEDEIKIVSEEFYYRFVTYVWTYVQFAFVVWGVFVIARRDLSVLEWIGFTLGFAVVTGGIGITVAHELGHKKSSLERLYSKILLMTVCYMHFYIEHNRGHHVMVATPEDPATAKRNESFYSFWVRSVFKGYAHAWQLENERLRKKGKSMMSLDDEMIAFALLPLLFCASLTVIASLLMDRITWEVPVFFFTQSILAFTLLELVNYVEHYGIARREISPGKYEKVNPLHSWNASHMLSNFFLFQLQRHSDHHLTAHKRYQVLDHHDESPQLPFGYPTMIMLALIPPVWFGIMNARLDSWSKKKEERLSYPAGPAVG